MTLPAQDAVDGGLGDREALVVGDPGSKLTTAQFRRSTCHRQDRLLLRLTQAVPGCQAASRLILKPLAPLLARQPTDSTRALGDTQVLEYLTLWKRGRSYPGQDRRLLGRAHGVGDRLSSAGTRIAVFLIR